MNYLGINLVIYILTTYLKNSQGNLWTNSKWPDFRALTVSGKMAV